ncbi:MAG: ATP-binding cassette domain-containing protein, partial [Pseudomonadota bacterium]
MTASIAIEGLVKSFGSKHVLQGVDLHVPAGQSTVIIGGSGTGKSVTLKCVLGLIAPDAGRILVGEEDVTRARGAGRARLLARFGMLFQGGALFDSLPVWENVAFRLRHGRGALSRTDGRDLAIEKLRRVGLGPETADLFPAELSGGMQKRVGLARA